VEVGSPSSFLLLCDTDASRLVQAVTTALKKRTIAAQHQTDCLKKATNTPLLLRFVQWLLTQSEKFYSDQGGLWRVLLVDQMGATAEQIEQLLGLRAIAQRPEPELDISMAKHISAVGSYTAESHEMLHSLLGVLTPQQAIRLFGSLSSGSPYSPE